MNSRKEMLLGSTSESQQSSMKTSSKRSSACTLTSWRIGQQVPCWKKFSSTFPTSLLTWMCKLCSTLWLTFENMWRMKVKEQRWTWVTWLLLFFVLSRSSLLEHRQLSTISRRKYSQTHCSWLSLTATCIDMNWTSQINLPFWRLFTLLWSLKDSILLTWSEFSSSEWCWLPCRCHSLYNLDSFCWPSSLSASTQEFETL